MEATSKGRCVRFGMFEADLAARELYKRGRRVPLQEQPFRILVILLSRPGQIVTREELQSELWPNGTHVEFSEGLDTALKKLRQALGDSAHNPTFIETIPRRGYRLIVSVSNGAELLLNGATAPSQGRLVEGTSLSPAITPRGFGWHRFPILLLLAVIVTALVVWRTRPVTTSVPIGSLAVLPLENLSGDASQDYFADGMTDQLITNLGQIHSLRVISRTSAMQYRGVRKPLPQVARELQVDAIVEGTVLRSGDKVRITAQLIQAREDRHLWAQSFEGDLKDVLVLQENVSRAIASQVQMALVPGEHIRAGVDRPLNMEAYESYLKGEYYLNRFSAESIQQALVHFQQAVEKDSGYAPGYAKMSGCYRMLANMGVLSKPEANEKAKALDAKALELDPNFGPAHAGRGWGLLLYDLDFGTAGDEFRRAVELSPNSAEAHQGLGDYYATTGRLQEAVHEVERARELDPLASIVNQDLCRMLTFARRWDEALAQCKANLELDPNLARALWAIGDIYTAKGMESEALSYLLRGLKAVGAGPKMMAAAEAGASRGGLKGCWRALIPFALEAVRKGEMDAFSLAVVYTRAGNADKAISWLHEALKTRSFGISFLRVEPTFDPLRSDPRFLSLLKDLGLMKHLHSN
jgi:TolB-like protein/DNA-binding winged helix-turn-helix (wHTH) protein